jgi:hypothetical protein
MELQKGFFGLADKNKRKVLGKTFKMKGKKKNKNLQFKTKNNTFK